MSPVLVGGMGGVTITGNPPTVYTNARLKSYPNKTVMQVATKSIFPLVPGVSQERLYDISVPGEAKNHERAMQESQRRAKDRVRDIALCSPFEYFFTWTLDGSLLDRYDPNSVYLKVKTFLGNAVKRKKFAYVLVPEYHRMKDEEEKPAIHMHGLCSIGAVPIVTAVSKIGRPLHDNHGRPIYNMPTWTWGFSTCVPVDSQYERAINYMTKYITKTEEKIFGKWYLASRNIVKLPELMPLDPIEYEEFRDAGKLKVHEQNESEIYDGLRIISEEFPPYNECHPKHLRRMIFACDEIASILDKTGQSKKCRDQIDQVVEKLSKIAQQGRSFGLHLILSTQRPDANLIPGQVRSNIDFKVCGRADSVLSTIIIDSAAASELIPKDAQGRFVVKDGGKDSIATVFQAYTLFDSGI